MLGSEQKKLKCPEILVIVGKKHDWCVSRLDKTPKN